MACDMMTTKLAGTGLGISHKIANALNSQIKFTSNVGTGSRFWFKLEVEKSNHKASRDQLIKHKTIHFNSVGYCSFALIINLAFYIFFIEESRKEIIKSFSKQNSFKRIKVQKETELTLNRRKRQLYYFRNKVITFY